jgi:uncharacterized protein YybS (DUF2232 family)
VQLLAYAAAAVALSLAAGYVPVLGAPVSLLAPTPILLVALRNGLQAGLLTLGLSTFALWGLFGMYQGLLFLSEYGVMAMVMARALQQRYPVEKTLFAASLLPLLVSGSVMVGFLWSTPLDFGAVRRYLEAHLAEALHTYLKADDLAALPQLPLYLHDALDLVLRVLPALLVISSVAGALLNYVVVRALWRRLGGTPPLPATSISRWQAPDVCVWILIGGGILLFLPPALLRGVGLNALLLVAPLYLMQGIGIVVFYLNRGPAPILVRWLAYLFLVLQPLLLLGVAGFGLFDLWFDFRRLRRHKEEPR